MHRNLIQLLKPKNKSTVVFPTQHRNSAGGRRSNSGGGGGRKAMLGVPEAGASAGRAFGSVSGWHVLATSVTFCSEGLRWDGHRRL